MAAVLLAAVGATAQEQAPPTLDPPEPRVVVQYVQETQNETTVAATSLSVDGDDRVDLTEPVIGGSPVWTSPDGSQLANLVGAQDAVRFTDAWGAPSRELVRVTSDGSVATPRVENGEFAPDGSLFAHTEPNGRGDYRIVITDVVDGGQRNVEAGGGSLDWILPDWIVAGIGDSGGSGVNYDAIEVDADEPSRIPLGQHQPFVSPDQQTIVTIESGADMARAHDAADFPALDNPRWTAPLTVHPFVGSLAFSPDGRWVSDGTTIVEVATGEVVGRLAHSRDEVVLTPAWSPDSSRMAVALLGDENRSVRVVTTDPDATDARTIADGLARGPLPVIGWIDDGEVVVLDTSRENRDDDVTFARIEDREGAEVGTIDTGRSGPRGADLVRPRSGGVDRYAGSDRVATAVVLSRAAFDDADAVVIARADLYPDALAGSALAGSVDGPTLLTPGGRLDDRVAAEVRRLGTDTAYVLGTADVLADGVVADLRAIGVSRVVRLGGADRFATAVEVAEEVGLDDGHVFLVEGVDVDPLRGWPDAVAAAGWAADTGRPVLLTPTDSLPSATEAFLRSGRVRRVTIVGGEVAVAAAVADRVAELGIRVQRIAGATRYATSQAVVDAQGNEVTLPFAVTGGNWPDALAAGPAAAHVGGTVVLVPPTDIVDDSDAAARFRSPSFDRVAVIGSTATVPQVTVRRMARWLAGQR